MSTITIFRPKQRWSVSPATVLPTGLLFHLLRPHSNYTVILDDHPVGKIGREQVKVFAVEAGEHRLCVRFVLLRQSKELRVSLKGDEDRQFICGSSGMGWPTLREATQEDLAGIRDSLASQPAVPGDDAPA
jgi:hypothetical protein